MPVVGEGGSTEPDVERLTCVVAVDGPAGSGKSTVARRTAQALGWLFVDTGATYRAVTLHVLRAGVDLVDADAVATAAAAANVELDVDPAGVRVLLDGEDVSAEIRGPAVTAAVSAVSAVPAVRAQLVALQRRLMGTQGAVVEGRDIATVVAPQAAVKVYLDASPEVRAQRRAGELGPAGGQAMTAGDEPAGAGLTLVEAALTLRDALDSKTNRLAPSEGAVHLDTSHLTIEEVVAALVELVRAAGLLPTHDVADGPGEQLDPQVAPAVLTATTGTEEERP